MHKQAKHTSSEPHSDWCIPSRYEVRQLIGTGSYGHVCEAYDRKEKRVVAIKRIHRVFEDLIDCKRVLREIAILNRLKHKNIVRTSDICVPLNLTKFDELYLVLEIADSDFKKLFKTPVYLSEIHVVTLLYNLLVGVKYTHSAGIYHRDLKPANCLVNQDCSVKICDFGLARTIDKRNVNHPMDENMPPSKKDMKRQLTGHVVTRWYRAPELILLQEKYTEAIDVWSIGCIYAELLGMMRENVYSYLDRAPIFPGSSCFPLSPDHKNHQHQSNNNDSSSSYYKFHTKGNRDQLNMIFNVLGTPHESDIQCLEKEDAKRYIRLFLPREGINFSRKFPGASPEAVNLLKRMLVFNPAKRITIDQALNSPLFKNIRNIKSETVAPTPIVLPFDDWTPMSEQELRYAFLAEVQFFHPNLDIPSEIKAFKYKSSENKNDCKQNPKN